MLERELGRIRRWRSAVPGVMIQKSRACRYTRHLNAELCQMSDATEQPVATAAQPVATRPKRHRGDGEIFQVGRVWYCRYSVKGKRHKESAKSTRRMDAVRLLNRRRAELAGGTFAPDAERATFEYLAGLVRADYTRQHRRSADRLERAFVHLAAEFAGARAVDIDAARLLAYWDKRHAEKRKDKACEVIVDPQRAPVIKQMFEKVANEQWSGRKLFAWLRYEVKFKTATGKFLSLGNIYMVLKKTFYYGVFEYPVGSGNWYTGQHSPIITKELYDRTQEQLVRSEINKDNKEFAFTRLISCGFCGSGVTACEKYKNQLNGNVHRYVYYRCTRSKNPHCEEGYIKEEEIIEQIIKILDTLDISELGIRHKFKDEITRYNKFRRIALCKSREKNPEPEEFDAKSYAVYLLTEGSITEKRELLSNLKSRLTLKGKAITIEGGAISK